MKKLLSTVLFLFLFSCEEEKAISYLTGEVAIQKIVDLKAFYLPSALDRSEYFIMRVEGTINEDITVKIYDEIDSRFITERIIPKGTYKYTTRDFRVDYYEGRSVIMKIIPMKGSEETFNLKWMIG